MLHPPILLETTPFPNHSNEPHVNGNAERQSGARLLPHGKNRKRDRLSHWGMDDGGNHGDCKKMNGDYSTHWKIMGLILKMWVKKNNIPIHIHYIIL